MQSAAQQAPFWWDGSSMRSGRIAPLTIQLLALPAFIPCLLMFLLPRYGNHEDASRPSFLDSAEEVPVETS